MHRMGAAKNILSDSSSDDDVPLASVKQNKHSYREESSSESDIGDYLQQPDKLDLDSSFFNLQKPVTSSEIQRNPQVDRCSDSEPYFERYPNVEVASTSKLNFSHLHEYTKKLEETKRRIEEYNARKQATEKEMNVDNLLAAGETKLGEELKKFEDILHSSDFESCSDSEKEGWEEVKEKEKEKNVIPKEGLQITVEMPGTVKKKKGVDLLLAIKRRINRVRKENQVLIHKVHLLCWIAHGNYVSSKINSENTLSVALSLLPSEKSYPDKRTDLKYLEQILKWYKNTVTNVEKSVPEHHTLEELLEVQITKREAFNKKMLVYIFIAVLRSLGIQCRLVLSFQVEPLRPPTSELHSLSSKDSVDDKKGVNVEKIKAESKCDEDRCNKSIKKAFERKSTDDSKFKVKNLLLKQDDEKNVKSKTTTGNKLEVKEIKTHLEGIIDIEKTANNKTVKRSESNKSNASKNEFRTSKFSEHDKVKSRSLSEKLKINSGTKPRTDTKMRSLSTKDKDEDANKKSSRTKSTSEIIKIKLKNKEEKNDKKIKSQVKLSVPQLDGANDTNSESSKPNLKKLKQKTPPCPIKEHPKRLKIVRKYRDSSDSEEDFAPRSPFTSRNKDSPQLNGANLKKLRSHVPKNDVRKDAVDIVKKSIKEQKDLNRIKKITKRKSTHSNNNDSDYVTKAIKKKRLESEDDFKPQVKVKKRVQVKQDPVEEKMKKKQGVDIWAEVFLEAEEKWISVDVVRGQIHCINELYKRASHPVSYIIAWNNDKTLKDITRRYCSNFNTVTRKLRVEPKWWEATLKSFVGVKTTRDLEEDDELERQQLEKPLPTSIAEYKNHPLYVLKRHLLKFEAIYPPEAPTLGFVRNEPVYSRHCVYTLHSRDIWLKHAKIVKLGEKPYKIVKARPRWDKLSNQVITDQMLEIFGPWQVEDYIPPTAENGIVPRNAFGNVELFKSCMLPKGTVHLKLPGLNKIAKRMDIDCASAIVGFDFHGGWSHPVYDGFVVCEEFADQLVMAWELEEEELEKKEEEKIEKRVYGNWKRLIRGLLIRERLKVKYDFGETSDNSKGKKKVKLPKLATKKK